MALGNLITQDNLYPSVDETTRACDKQLAYSEFSF